LPKQEIKYQLTKGFLMLICLGSLLCFSACSPTNKKEVDRLNTKSYAFHYRNIDSTYFYARQALMSATYYPDGIAEALNNLAFVSTIRMDYDGAYKLLKEVSENTDNQIELLVADVQCMRLCQRQSRNKDFYYYRENAFRKMRRIEEEKNELTDRQLLRITYATTEFHIINSTYFYYVGLKSQSVDALKKIDPFGPIQKDTAQLLSYFYNIGSGGIITKGTNKDISQEEFDYLMRCYILSKRYNYPFWEANSMQALSEHLQESKARDYLITNNLPDIKFINTDFMPDSLLAGNLAQRSLNMFLKYGDVYQTAGSYRTLAECYWQIKDYKSAITCLNKALYTNPVIERAPDLVASIREQLSLAYSAADNKQLSDYNRNIYLDMQEKTRQDRQLEARAEQLDNSSSTLNLMIFAVVMMIILVLVLLFAFDRMRQKNVKKFSIDSLLKPLRQWQYNEERSVISRNDDYDEISEKIQMENFHLSDNIKRNIEQRAKISLVNSILPFINRIINEIKCLESRDENEEIRKYRYSYISELTDKIMDYNNVLTNWIQLRQGQLSMHIESFQLQSLFDIVSNGSMGFSLKGIELIVQPTQAVVKADKILTLFMINTLADNARKFTPSGGKVIISCDICSDYVEISINDNGEGMTEEQTAKIFEHKNIVDEKLDKDNNSSKEISHGFGLMNCKGIIERYHKISQIFSVCSIYSDSIKGKGSRFAFRLPKGIIRTLLCLLVSLFSYSSFAAKDVNLVVAEKYADSAYYSNINGNYTKTLWYAQTCRNYLNRYYLSENKTGCDTMKYVGSESVPAEIKWFRKHLKTDYDVILDVRNETAVAALALHLWDVYHYNNRLYTQLFRERSADNTLGEYVRVMQKSENNKNVAIILLIIMLISIFPAYYFLYYRHRLYYRLCLEKVNNINDVLLSDINSADKLSKIQNRWKDASKLLKASDSKLNDVVGKIEHALQISVEQDKLQTINTEAAIDELHKIEYENERLHISNNVLDNCLSTLKHETMYYPSRIRQLVDSDEDNLNAISETANYYRELYSLLSLQAMRQIDTSIKVDDSLIKYLFDLLKKLSGEKSIDRKISHNDNNYVIINVELSNLKLNAKQCAELFTPASVNIGYMICRQIVREIGEATNLRGCGIQASQNLSGGTDIELILPSKLKIV
jgi:signal transduction histidine kinase